MNKHQQSKSCKNGFSSHVWMMLLACGGAAALIFILPLFGLSKDLTLILSMVFMVGLHAWMMKDHFQ